MTAKLVRLSATKRGPISVPGARVVFPEVYRLRGYYFDIPADAGCVLRTEDISPSNRPAPITYALDAEFTDGMANVTHEPIRMLDPDIDDGWVHVRHHRSDESFDSYLDGIRDTKLDYYQEGGMLFRNDFGLFTVVHRPAAVGCMNHLLIYTCKMPLDGMMTDHTIVISPTGERLSEEVLVPEEVSESFGELATFIEGHQ